VVQDAVTTVPGDFDGLFDLFERLRLAGFRVDVTHLQHMQDVILAAAASGAPLDDRERIRNWLGPIVCQSAADQREFVRIFDAWSRGRGEQPTDRGARPDVLVDLDRADTASRRWRWLIIVPLAAGCVLALFYFRPTGALPIEGPPPEPSSTSLIFSAWTLLALAVGVMTYLLLWVRLAGRFLVRESGPPPRSIESLPLRAISRRLYSSIDAAKVASACRARVLERGHDIDPTATIERTMASGGLFSPVFGHRRIMPEYLALIDRKGHRDQQSAFLDDLFNQLVRRGVWVQRYYFDGDPRLCFSERITDEPTTLFDLANHFSDHRLLVCADLRVFADPLTGEPAGWVRALASWRERAVLIPGSPYSTRFRELLAEHLAVLPATLEGIHSFVAQLRGQQQPEVPRLTGAAIPPPAGVAADPERWVEPSEPEDRLVAALVASLRAALPPFEFSWLSACAVYPAMHWNMTLTLGYALEERSGARLVTSRSVATLAQLPWFRHGYMPDWVRRRLVDGMSPAEDRVVRETLDALLIAAARGGTGDLALQIATAASKVHQRLALFVRTLLMRRGDAPPEWSDYIFLRFIAGRRTRSLAVRVPHAFRSLHDGGRHAGVAMTVPAIAETRGIRVAAAGAWIAGPASILAPLFTRDRYVRFHVALAVMAGALVATLVGVLYARIGVAEIAVVWFGAAAYPSVRAWRGRPALIPLLSAIAWSLVRERVALDRRRSTSQLAIGVLLCRPSIYAEVIRDSPTERLVIWLLATATAAVGLHGIVRWFFPIQFVDSQPELERLLNPGLAALIVSVLMTPFLWISWAALTWLAARMVVRQRTPRRFTTDGLGTNRAGPPPFRDHLVAVCLASSMNLLAQLLSVALLVSPGVIPFSALTMTNLVGGFFVVVALYAGIRAVLYDYRVWRTIVVFLMLLMFLMFTSVAQAMLMAVLSSRRVHTF
jgi:hypothetical protein